MRRTLVLVAALFLMAGRVVVADPITVSAAISLKEALTEIGQAYNADGNHPVTFNFGASGTLETQIEQGAPVDAFVSAGLKEMNALGKGGFIDAATRKTVALNQLVLVVPADAANPPTSFADLADARFAKVAIGQPRSVPAGQYAMQTLTHLKIADAFNGRLIYGANVRQVLDYVERGEVDAGIVYATDAAAAGKTVKVAATADEAWHDPIQYPAAVIKGRPNAAEAGKFLEFVESDAGKKILSAHRFSVPGSGSAATQPDAAGSK